MTTETKIMNWRDNQINSYKKKIGEKKDDLAKIDFLLFVYNNTMIQRTEPKLDEFIIDSLCRIQCNDLVNNFILQKTTSFLKEISRQEIENDFRIIHLN